MKIDKSLILIGMMGSGKTTTAKILANHLQRKHIDLDDYLTSHYQKSIDELIQYYGLENFRIIEDEFFKKISEENSKPLVISLGGGTFSHKNNLDSIQDGLTIYLKCSTDTLIQRLQHPEELNKRPLIKNSKLDQLPQILAKLLDSRNQLYQQASLCIECDHLSVDKISLKIIEEISRNL